VGYNPPKTVVFTTFSAVFAPRGSLNQLHFILSFVFLQLFRKGTAILVPSSSPNATSSVVAKLISMLLPFSPQQGFRHHVTLWFLPAPLELQAAILETP
jgi:hypothetical protein